MGSENTKEVSDHVVRSGRKSCGDSWSQVNQPLVQDIISGCETAEVWLTTEPITVTMDLSLKILKVKLVLSEFFALFIVELERPVRIYYWHWSFLAFKLFNFPFFSWAINSTGLFILLLCTRKMHSDSKCIKI